MKRYQSTLTKMTRPVCMALAALLMVGAMASCSENENTETAQSDNAYLSLSFSTGTGNSTRAGETSGKALPTMRLMQILLRRTTSTTSRCGCSNQIPAMKPLQSLIKQRR